MPGSRSTVGSPRCQPLPAGCDPVASTTTSGVEAFDLARLHRGVQPDDDLELRELALVPVDEVEDLRAPRLHPGEAELPAEPGRGLGEGDPVAALRRDPGRLQPGRPPAHDEDRARVTGRVEPVPAPLELAARGRIDEAAHPVVARPPPPAHLVAREAGAHVLGAALAGLVRHVGVRDLAADDAHHVRLAGADHLVRVLRGADMALRLHLGVPDGLPDPFRERRTELVLVQERRHEAGELEVAARAHRDVVVEPALVMPRRDLLLILDREDVGTGRVDADAHPDDEVGAAPFADPFEGGGREAHAAIEGAAPAVVAAVGERRPELLEERVVRGHDLAAVEARFLRAARGLREPFDELLDLGAGHRVAAVLVVHRGQAGRRPVRLVREVEVAVRADVVELLDHDRAVLAACVGDPAKVRDHRVVAVAEVAAGQDRGAVDRHRLDHDHRRPAPRPLEVVAEVPFGGKPLGAHVGRVGAEVEAMLERLRADPDGAEEVREGRHIGVSGAWSFVSGQTIPPRSPMVTLPHRPA